MLVRTVNIPRTLVHTSLFATSLTHNMSLPRFGRTLLNFATIIGLPAVQRIKFGKDNLHNS